MSGSSSTQRHESNKQTNSDLHCRSHDRWRLVAVPSEKDEIEDWKVGCIVIGDDLYATQGLGSDPVLAPYQSSVASRIPPVGRLDSKSSPCYSSRTVPHAPKVRRSIEIEHTELIVRRLRDTCSATYMTLTTPVWVKRSCDRAAARSMLPAPPASCSGQCVTIRIALGPRIVYQGLERRRSTKQEADDLPSGVSFPRRKALAGTEYTVPYCHSLLSTLLELPEGYVHETRLSNVQSSLAFFSIHRTCKPTFFMFPASRNSCHPDTHNADSNTKYVRPKIEGQLQAKSVNSCTVHGRRTFRRDTNDGQRSWDGPWGNGKYQVIGIHGRGGDGKMTRWTFEQDWKESPQQPRLPSSPFKRPT